MSGADLVSGPENEAPDTPSLSRGTPAVWRCPECLGPVKRRQATQLFCSPEHKRAYANRWVARGSVIAPLYAAARATRGGSRGDKATGTRARADAEHLVQRWRDEDAAVGRMPVTAYVAERYRLGLVEVA